MAQLTKKQMHTLRVAINRALQGPTWFSEVTSPEGYELRNQTRTWLRLNIVRELQQILPPDERVSTNGVKHVD